MRQIVIALVQRGNRADRLVGELSNGTGRLFSGRLVAFPGIDIMMVRSHEV